jgi:hypothetical protein
MDDTRAFVAALAIGVALGFAEHAHVFCVKEEGST